MYDSFFKLTGKPFQLNPDPSFFYGSRGHKRAMAYLEDGLHRALRSALQQRQTVHARVLDLDQSSSAVG